MNDLTSFFTFDFSNEDDDTISVYRFTITGPHSQYEAYYRAYNDFEEQAMNAEVYGIHDVFAHPGDLEGFTSYEVDPDQYMTVMEMWHKWFADAGFEVGDIFKVKTAADGSEHLTPAEEERNDKVWEQLELIRDKIFANR